MNHYRSICFVLMLLTNILGSNISLLSVACAQDAVASFYWETKHNRNFLDLYDDSSFIWTNCINIYGEGTLVLCGTWAQNNDTISFVQDPCCDWNSILSEEKYHVDTNNIIVRIELDDGRNWVDTIIFDELIKRHWVRTQNGWAKLGRNKVDIYYKPIHDGYQYTIPFPYNRISLLIHVHCIKCSLPVKRITDAIICNGQLIKPPVKFYH